jgi:two-component system sensor histidine kinase CpxA
MMIGLFLPLIIIALLDIFQDRDGFAPSGIMQILEWGASKVAEESEPVDDEMMESWIADINEKSDLEIYIRRGERNFYTSGSEWLVSYSPAPETLRPGRPIISSAVSRSGNSTATVALYPFGPRFGPRQNDFRGLRIPMPILVAVLLCLVFSFILVRNFVTPLSELGLITGKMQGGDLSVQVGPGVTGRGDEFADLGRSFNKMASRMENLLSSQKRLLIDISHEIRSPLQCVEVAAALLRKECGDGGEKHVERIELEIRRIDNMVEELLTLTRIEDTQTARRDLVELDEIIGSIAEEVSFAHNVDHGRIHVNTRKLSVAGDEVLLSRALGNVIYNATRYTPPDTGIEIDARLDGDMVAVVVKDHGQGVPKDELDKIFLPYYRTDKARAKSQGNSGLGLAISKRIIESHGGCISASNAPTGGLVVTIHLPASAR